MLDWPETCLLFVAAAVLPRRPEGYWSAAAGFDVSSATLPGPLMCAPAGREQSEPLFGTIVSYAAAVLWPSRYAHQKRTGPLSRCTKSDWG